MVTEFCDNHLRIDGLDTEKLTLILDNPIPTLYGDCEQKFRSSRLAQHFSCSASVSVTHSVKLECGQIEIGCRHL